MRARVPYRPPRQVLEVQANAVGAARRWDSSRRKRSTRTTRPLLRFKTRLRSAVKGADLHVGVGPSPSTTMGRPPGFTTTWARHPETSTIFIPPRCTSWDMHLAWAPQTNGRHSLAARTLLAPTPTR